MNKCANGYFKKELIEWFAAEIAACITVESDCVNVDLSLSRMKLFQLGAKWLLKLYDYLCGKPEIIINGFRESGILDVYKH